MRARRTTFARPRVAFGACLVAAGAIAPVALLASCATMPSTDCSTENNCAPGGDDAGDATMLGDGAGASDAPSADRTDTGEVGPDTSVVHDASVDATTDAEAGSAGDAAMDAADGFDGFDGFTCDPTKSPHDDPCVLANTLGVFVSSGGLDTNAGTLESPLKTITAGLSKANALGVGRVYVCQGSYAETLKVTSAVSVYGGLACPLGDGGWVYGDGGAAQVTGAANAIAFTVDGVDASIAVEDLRVVSPDAVGQDDAGNGRSSIAALVNGSAVTFTRCTFIAGAGANGADGITGSNYDGGTAPSGQSNDGGAGGPGGFIVCGDGTSSTGGRGGDSTPTGGADGSAVPMPIVVSPVDGLGGAGGLVCVVGDPGGNGAAGVAGAAGSTVGVWSDGGWVGSGGSRGANGQPGQGGGGGGGKSLAPAQGGTGGGAGGCGGIGGPGGYGAGASIALVCLGGGVSLNACTLISSDAGTGGAGGNGQAGQAGGVPGPSTGACPGGNGGAGAGGAGGGGGAGGISVCILYGGTAPIGTPLCTTGGAGMAGRGGIGGPESNGVTPINSGPDGSAGLPGISQTELSIP